VFTDSASSAHEVLGGRRNQKVMSRRTKNWVVRMRVVQLVLRILQLVAAIGVLVLMILLKDVELLTTWVMRITVQLSRGPTAGNKD